MKKNILYLSKTSFVAFLLSGILVAPLLAKNPSPLPQSPEKVENGTPVAQEESAHATSLPFFTPPKDIYALLESLSNFYVTTFAVVKVKKATSLEAQKEAKKNAHLKYELNSRSIAEAYFNTILVEGNPSLSSFDEQRKGFRAQLPLKVAEDLRIISREQGDYLLTTLMPEGTQIGKIAMLLRLVYPLTDRAYLKKEQEIVKILLQKEDIYNRIEATSNRLETLEPTAVSLLRGPEDYLFSLDYKEIIKKCFSPNKGGKYTKMIGQEIKKRLWFDTLLFMLLLCELLAFFAIKQGLKWREQGDREIGMNAIGSGILWGVLLFMFIIQKLVKYYRVIRYINKRLGEFQNFFQAIAQLHAFLQSQPELYKLLAPKLENTRKLLALSHPDPNVNRLIKALQRSPFNRFRWYHLFFASTGKLLVTMSAIETYTKELGAIFFEWGMIESYFATAKLMKKQQGQKHAFAFPQYVEKEKIHLEASSLWNPLIDPKVVKSNNLFIDGKTIRTLAVTGANGSGKSVFTSLVPITFILGQTLGIGAASPTAPFRLTPISLFLAFKEPKDDLEHGNSLFTVESTQAALFLQLLMLATKKKQKSLLLCDEFFVSTNIPQQKRLQFAYTNYINRHAPYNLIVISTHNEDLIKKFVKSPDALVMQTRIKRFHNGKHPDFKPLYEVVEGATREKVGFLLFYKKLLEYKELEEAAEEIIEEAKAES